MKTKKIQPQCESERVALRFPRASDSAEFTSRAVASKRFHKDLVFPPGDQEAFLEYVKQSDVETGKSFLIIEKSTGQICGAVNLSQIFLKGFCSAYLGYYLFEGFAGRGLMTSALKDVQRVSFDDLGLHRLEANIQPGNDKSIKLVERCGFQKEGFSTKYLFIAGEWRDHERWAIIKEDWKTQIDR